MPARFRIMTLGVSSLCPVGFFEAIQKSLLSVVFRPFRVPPPSCRFLHSLFSLNPRSPFPRHVSCSISTVFPDQKHVPPSSVFALLSGSVRGLPSTLTRAVGPRYSPISCIFRFKLDSFFLCRFLFFPPRYLRVVLVHAPHFYTIVPSSFSPSPFLCATFYESSTRSAVTFFSISAGPIGPTVPFAAPTGRSQHSCRDFLLSSPTRFHWVR